MKQSKLTKLEKYWILYDVGNSAFIMLVSTIIPIYFNYLAGNAGISEVDYLAYWVIFLAVFVIAKVGYNASLIFYDSMLVDVTTSERMDTVSSHGYAWGYIGSCIPFAI